MRIISGQCNGEYVIGRVIKTVKSKLMLSPGFRLKRQDDGHFSFVPITEVEGIMECQASELEMKILDFLATHYPTENKLTEDHKKTRALFDLHAQGFDVILIDQETRTITPYQK